MLPPVILFDLDDTLFDHRHAAHAALTHLHETFAAAVPYTDFAAEHARVLESHHQRFLRGEVSLVEARVARMVEAFAQFGQRLDRERAEEIAAEYRHHHRSNRRLVPGAQALLESLVGKARLALVSNNATAEQYEKLHELNITHFFDVVIISEQVGLCKPDPAIFALALAKLAATADQAVMVGDNWENDILGAAGAGIAAIWVTPLAPPAPLPTRVTHLFDLISTSAVHAALAACHSDTGEQHHANVETLAA